MIAYYSGGLVIFCDHLYSRKKKKHILAILYSAKLKWWLGRTFMIICVYLLLKKKRKKNLRKKIFLQYYRVET